MGSTPRPNKFSVPMMTRSTDVSMMGQCEGRFWLTLFNEDDQAEASFFALGSALHAAIEQSIVSYLDLDTALDLVRNDLLEWIESLEGKRVIESSNRGVATILDDAERMLRNWFRFVHPDSDKRHPLYDDYEWPPRVEVPFTRSPESAGTQYPVWGSIDAIFTAKDGSHVRYVDWKSSTSLQKNSNQLHHYIFGSGVDINTVQGHYHNLDRVRKPSIVQEMDPYPGDDVVRDRILATEFRKEEVLDGRKPEFSPDWYCNYCPVQQHCPAEGEWRNRLENKKKLDAMLPWARPLTELS